MLRPKVLEVLVFRALSTRRKIRIKIFTERQSIEPNLMWTIALLTVGFSSENLIKVKLTLYSPLYCRSRSNVQAKVMSHSSESIVNPSKGIYVEMEGIMEVRNTQTSHQGRSSSFPNFISFALEGALRLWLSRPLEQSRARGLQIFPGASQVGVAFQ